MARGEAASQSVRAYVLGHAEMPKQARIIASGPQKLIRVSIARVMLNRDISCQCRVGEAMKPEKHPYSTAYGCPAQIAGLNFATECVDSDHCLSELPSQMTSCDQATLDDAYVLVFRSVQMKAPASPFDVPPMKSSGTSSSARQLEKARAGGFCASASDKTAVSKFDAAALFGLSLRPEGM